MPEETVQATTVSGQADGATAGQSTTVPSQATSTEQATGAAQDGAPKTYDEAYVKTLRQEAAGYRTKLKSFEDAEAARQQAAMTETEKLQQRAEAAEKRAKELEVEQIRTKAAAKHSLPEDLHEFITAQDEAGANSQAEKLAAKLKASAGGSGLPAAGTRQPASPGDAGSAAQNKERFAELQRGIPSLHNRVFAA